MMETADVAPHPDRKDAALLSFKERYLAEKFLGQAKEIPHIGNVELSWAANPNPPTFSTPTALTGATTSAFGTTALGNGSAGGGDIKMEEAGGDVGRGAEVDYDVADDDDRWLVE